MVQPWFPPSPPSLPTCSWRSLKSKPSALPLTPNLWLRFVDDTSVSLTLIIYTSLYTYTLHFPSISPSVKRQNTANNCFTTSIHITQTYSSQWRNQIKMGLFPSQTPMLHQDPTVHFKLPSRGNQHTLINTYIWTTTTS